MSTEEIRIGVDREVFAVLQSKAAAFVDTPNTVLRREFGLDGGGGTAAASSPPGPNKPPGEPGTRKAKEARAPSGALLPEKEYEVPLLRALVDAGGRGPSNEIIDAVGRQLDGRLATLDREMLTSGEIRWRNRTQFARLRLVQRGLMDGSAPRGVWAITENGRRFLRDEGS